MGEPGRIQAFLGWWRELPTGWRVNAGLYALAGVSLIALLTQIVVGGDSGPRRVEVAAGRMPRPTTTAVAPSTTEPTTTTEPPTTEPPTTAAPGGPATTARPRAGTAARGRATPSPDPVTFEPTPTTLACRNSRDPACGQFSWDPPPGDNAGLEITVNAPQTAKVNDPVKFSVTVTDPDHVVTGNCTDVAGAQGEGFPCTPPTCPPAYGPWTPPPRQRGTRTFTFEAKYTSPGTKEVVFTFRTDRDGCQDPYGSVGTRRVTVEVAAADPAG